MVDGRWTGINILVMVQTQEKQSTQKRFHSCAILSATYTTLTGLHSPCFFITPDFMKQSSSWEDNRFSASQEIPRIITAFTKERYPSVLWARSIQSTRPTHFLKIHFGIVLPFRPGSSLWSLSLRFPTKTLYAPLLTPTHATCPAHVILHELLC
jgi:hypothetical protein